MTSIQVNNQDYKAPGVAVVTYGDLMNKITRRVPRPPILQRVKKPGVAGFFGQKHDVHFKQDPAIEIAYENVLLSDVTFQKSDAPAQFAALTVNACISESGANVRYPSLPVLTVVAEPDAVAKLIDFVRARPAEYNSLLKEICPRREFPNVNAGILDRVEPPKEIILISGLKVKELMKTGMIDYESVYQHRLPHYRKYATQVVYA